LVPSVLKNFETILPVIREVVIYLQRVINKEIVQDYKDEFESILNAHYMRFPYINLWLSYLFRNRNFNEINIPEEYDTFLTTRAKALIALRKKDTTWIKGFRDGIDLLGPWDKRAILFSSSLLSLDEMEPWVNAVATSGDIIDKSISKYLISKKREKKQISGITIYPEGL
jgi:hypothetical protein